MRQGCVLLLTVTIWAGSAATFAATQPCTAISITPASVPDGNYPAAAVYPTQTLTAAPGDSYEFAVTDGALPSGLALTNASGAQIEISGTPLESGTFLFTVTATDPSSGCSGGRTYVITVFECGDGELDPGEECDDGNLLAADLCSPTCAEIMCFGLPFDDPLVCTEHGECIAADDCDCYAGWVGNDCKTVVCEPECIRGTCVEPGVCDCTGTGYSGPTCSSPICDTVDCGAHGNCCFPEECCCEKGWTGDTCDQCADYYHGENCIEHIGFQPAYWHDDFTLRFYYEIPTEYVSGKVSYSTDCSGRFKFFLGTFGSNPTCTFVDVNGLGWTSFLQVDMRSSTEAPPLHSTDEFIVLIYAVTDNSQFQMVTFRGNGFLPPLP